MEDELKKQLKKEDSLKQKNGRQPKKNERRSKKKEGDLKKKLWKITSNKIYKMEDDIKKKLKTTKKPFQIIKDRIIAWV